MARTNHSASRIGNGMKKRKSADTHSNQRMEHNHARRRSERIQKHLAVIRQGIAKQEWADIEALPGMSPIISALGPCVGKLRRLEFRIQYEQTRQTFSDKADFKLARSKKSLIVLVLEILSLLKKAGDITRKHGKRAFKLPDDAFEVTINSLSKIAKI